MAELKPVKQQGTDAIEPVEQQGTDAIEPYNYQKLFRHPPNYDSTNKV